MSDVKLCCLCLSICYDNETLYLLDTYYGEGKTRIPAHTFISNSLHIHMNTDVDSNTTDVLLLCHHCNSTLQNFYSFYIQVTYARYKYQIKNEEETLPTAEEQLQSNEESFKNTMNEVIIMDETGEELPRYNYTTSDVIISEHIEEKLVNDKIKVSRKRKVCQTKSRAKRKRVEVESDKSRRMTAVVLSKYKKEEIFAHSRWKIPREDRDEIFNLYVDMKCRECKITFPNFDKLEEHCVEEHDDRPSVTCDDNLITSYEQLERHILYTHILGKRAPKLNIRSKHLPTVVPRGAAATKQLFSKYTKEQLYSDGKWNINEEEKNEIFKWYVDMNCKQCGLVFPNFKELNDHTLKEHKTRPYLMCENSPLQSIQQLERHILYRHILDMPMPVLREPCIVCSKMIRSKIMKEHLLLHLPSDQRIFQCDYCKMGFSSKTALKNHIRINHRSEIVKCKVCQTLCSNLSDLYRHMNEKGCGVCQKCPDCGRSYKNIRFFKIHMERHLNSSLKCELCDDVFKSRFQLRLHVNKLHGPKSYLCSDCGEEYRDIDLYELHMKVHHGVETDVKCEVCGQGFKTVGDLNNHRKKIHSGKSQLCSVCGVECLTVKAYIRHKRIFHGIIERVNCSVCGLSVPKFNISRHVFKHDTSKLKQCSLCAYKGYELDLHIKRIHEKSGRRETCPVCSGDFADMNTLRRHIQVIHSGKPRHTCEICSAPFANWNRLKKHRKEMHLEIYTNNLGKPEKSGANPEIRVRKRRGRPVVQLEGDQVKELLEVIEKRKVKINM